MNPRTLTFLFAVVILAGFGIALSWARRHGRPFFDAKASDSQNWSLTHLLLASFLTLFAELAFIRWIAVEVRAFAYFKNLALLLCFVGFGLGCALARKTPRWPAGVLTFLGLLLLVRLPIQQGIWLEGLSQSLGAAAAVDICATWNSWRSAVFLVSSFTAAALTLLLTWL